MLYEYDPISCIGMKVSTKDGMEHMNERKVIVNGETFIVWSDQIARRTMAKSSSGEEKPISGSGYISNEGTIKKAIKQTFMHDSKAKDADSREVAALNNVKKVYANISKSDDILHDYQYIKQTASSVKDPKIKEEITKVLNDFSTKLRSMTH